MKKTVISYINKRTNESFVSAEKSASSVTLTAEDGETKKVSISTFNRWYKRVETEIEVEEPKTEEKPMTKHQKAALENIYGAYTYVMGGYENSLQDGYINELPAIEDLFEEVYDEALMNGHQMRGGLRMDGGPAPFCMRFAGKAFVREHIAKMFREDGHKVPKELLKVPEKKKGHSNIVDGERVNLRIDTEANRVTVRAFTGMLIGEFKIEKETAKTIIVKTHKGKMKFDKVSGIQLDARNPKFANRIDR